MGATYQPTQWLMPDNANTDKVGNYSFNCAGVDDYIEIAATSALNPTTAITIGAWVKPNASQAEAYPVLICKGTINANYLIFLQSGAAHFRISYSPNYETLGTTDLRDGQWHHVVGTFDGTTLSIYVDGVLENSNAPVGAAIQTEGITAVGIGGTVAQTNEFTGEISEVCVFDYALTSGQITTLYGDATNGVGNPMGLTPVPAAYWKGDRAALGAQWAIPNQVSEGYVFDFAAADDDYVSMNNVLNLEYNVPWSMSVWINLNALSGIDPIIAKRPNGWPNNGYQLSHKNTGNIEFVLAKLYTSNSIEIDTTSAPLTAGIWHNIVVTYDGSADESGFTIYVDGSSVAFTDTYNSLSATTSNGEHFRLGKRGGGNNFDGKMSNAAIFNSELSSANAITIYNNGVPGDLTSLSPVSWWKLDSSATFSTNWSIPDTGSASNTGTSYNMTQANLIPDTVTRGTAMYSEYSFDFDGTDDRFTMGNVLASTFEYDAAFSISAWIYIPTLAANQVFFSKLNNSAPYDGMQLVASTAEVQIYLINTWGTNYYYNTTTTAPLSASTWHNIVVTKSTSSLGAGATIYVDGISQAFTTTSDSLSATTANTKDLQISGRDGANLLMTGKVSNVAVFNSELSQANVTTIYNNGRPGDLTSLSPIAWWRMGEEAFATVAAPTAWTIPDQIGSSDGTSVGNPDLVGEAPQSFANGLSVSMDIYDRMRESGFSDDNALSYNMPEDTRKAY